MPVFSHFSLFSLPQFMPIFSHFPYHCFAFPCSCRFCPTFRILSSSCSCRFTITFRIFESLPNSCRFSLTFDLLFPYHHAGFVSLSVFCLFLHFPHFRALRALRLRSSLSGTFLSPGYYIVNQYQLGVCPAICPIFHSSPSLSVPVAPHLSPPPTPSLVLVFFPPLIHSLPTSVSSVRRMPHGQASMFV